MENKLTFKEKLALHLILLALKIIKPFPYSYENNQEIEKISKILNND